MEASSVVAIIAVSVSSISVIVSAVSTALILRAADRRFTAEQAERSLQRKRETVAAVLAASAHWRDSTSGLILRVAEVSRERITLESADEFKAWLEASYVPAQREFLTSVSVARLTIDDYPVIEALGALLDFSSESFTDLGDFSAVQVERLKLNQAGFQEGVSMLRERAFDLYGERQRKVSR